MSNEQKEEQKKPIPTLAEIFAAFSELDTREDNEYFFMLGCLTVVEKLSLIGESTMSEEEGLSAIQNIHEEISRYIILDRTKKTGVSC